MPSISGESELLSLEHLRLSEVFPKQNAKIVNFKGEIEHVNNTSGGGGTICADSKTPAEKSAQNRILPHTSSSSSLLYTTTSNLSFKLLPGEYIDYYSRFNNNNNNNSYSNQNNQINGTTLYLTNFRLFVQYDSSNHNAKFAKFYSIPVRCMDSVECRDLFYLHIYCKDGRFVKLTFENSECCSCWFRILTSMTSPPPKLDLLFAFAFNAWCTDTAADSNSTGAGIGDGDQSSSCLSELGFKSLNIYGGVVIASKTLKDTENSSHFRLPSGQLRSNSCCSGDIDTRWTCQNEFDRLQFDPGHFRITEVNEEYKFCPTYPKFFIVPVSSTDSDIDAAARYRSLRRVPAIVWRHKTNGAVLVRCSQPESGIFGWRSPSDESLLQAILTASAASPSKKACPKSTTDNNNGQQQNGSAYGFATETPKPMLILDARSYAAAWANRAKGGGFESTEYYRNCEIQFLGLANIHSIRYSFQKLRTICWETPETASWYQNLDSTQWVYHVWALLSSALRVVEALHVQERTVLVHCSDGWDRTTQIVSLAKLMLDPYYRTMKGFKELIEREWIAFGHKFGERSGLLPGGDSSQRAPVFLQWLDCVHYLYRANLYAFEFNEIYLVKLAQHSYSGLFGTFLCNSVRDYALNNVGQRTYSIWAYLHPLNPEFRNLLYIDPSSSTTNACQSSVASTNCPGHHKDRRRHRDNAGSSNGTNDVLLAQFRMRDLAEIWRLVYCPMNDDPTMNNRRLNDTTISSSSFTTSTSDDKSERTLMALSSLAIVDAAGEPVPQITSSQNDLSSSENALQIFNNNKQTAELNNKCGFTLDAVEYDDSDVYVDKNIVEDKDTVVKGCGGGRDIVVDHRVIVDETLNKMISDILTKLSKDQEDSEIPTISPNDHVTCFSPDKTSTPSKKSHSPSYAHLLTGLNIDPIESLLICEDEDIVDDEDEVDDGYSSKPPTINRTVSNDVSTSTTDISDPHILSAAAECPISNLLSTAKCYNCPYSGDNDILLFTNDILTTTDINANNKATTGGGGGFAKNYFAIDDFCGGGNENNRTGQDLVVRVPPTLYTAGRGTNSKKCGGGGNGKNHQHSRTQDLIDPDGLTKLSDDVQERVREIVFDYEERLESLQMEVNRLKKCLYVQATLNVKSNDQMRCRRYTSDEANSDCSVPEPNSVNKPLDPSSKNAAGTSNNNNFSDTSWEAVDEAETRSLAMPTLTSATPMSATLWVPDHAMPRCMNCGVEFWAVIRKHHCRSCGMLFCNACTNYESPVPSEQFYEPVRVCHNCYWHLNSQQKVSV